jgi:hypothetical protein
MINQAVQTLLALNVTSVDNFQCNFGISNFGISSQRQRRGVDPGWLDS